MNIKLGGQKKIILLTVGAAIIIAAFSWFLSANRKIAVNTTLPPQKTETTKEAVKQEVILIINSGEASDTVKLEYQEGMTAFDLLKKGMGELNIFLESKNYDFGVFVEKIGDKKNGEEGKYWLYYANGQMPMIAADKLELKPGDRVEFRFEKSSFK